MNTKTTLYLLCGKMAAGKSTLAQHLSQQLQVIVICEDDLLAALYPGEVTDVATYIKFSNRIRSAIEPSVVGLLSQGTSLILDFPANTVKQRAWLLNLAKQANVEHELHFLDVTDAVCKVQLRKRALEHPERAPTDTIEMFDAISQYFEAPNATEGLSILLVDRSTEN